MPRNPLTPPTVHLSMYRQRPGKRYATIKAYIRRNKKSIKFLTSDINAPSDLLQRFDYRGELKPGEVAPKWLQEDIRRFYTCAQTIGLTQIELGKFDTMPSQEISDMVRDLYFHTTEKERG